MSVQRKPFKKKISKKKSGPLRAALIVVLLMLAAAVLLGAVLVLAPLIERADPTPVEGSADWMRRVDDETPLNEIVLPGTHASAAVHTPRAFFTKTQSLNITEQLKAGFRLLDLQLAATEGGSGFRLLYEGSACRVSQYGRDLTLDDVLAQCRAFLYDHPTETVLLSLRLTDPSLSTRRAQLLLDAYMRENPQVFLFTDTIPTLGEARGRMVILRSWADELGLREAAGLPLRWRDQGGSEDLVLQPSAEELESFTLYVQDRYQYPVEDKWDAFLGGLHGTEDGAVSLSFLSTAGDSRYGHPFEYAKDLNSRLAEYDGTLQGWILVDFGSAAIAQRIWRENF